jgi:hypothetical protein
MLQNNFAPNKTQECLLHGLKILTLQRPMDKTKVSIINIVLFRKLFYFERHIF